MTLTDKTKFYCSFCGKMQDEVERLIAGPTVFICNECVGLCNDIINEARWEKWFHKRLKEKGLHVVPLPPSNLTSSLDKFNAFHRS